jgi:DNA-binding NarL/FixJ family response regulator
LVVDDSPVALQTLCTCVLEHPAVQVVGTATGGREAEALAGKLHPDLILLDLLMPKVSGFEVASWLASEHPSIKVIAVTSLETSSDLERRLRDHGVRGLVSKEHLSEQLLKLIDRVLHVQHA